MSMCRDYGMCSLMFELDRTCRERMVETPGYNTDAGSAKEQRRACALHDPAPSHCGVTAEDRCVTDDTRTR